MNARFGFALAFILCISSLTAVAEAKTYKFGTSIYAGWMPEYYMEDAGILDKWAKKYGVDIEIVKFPDYIASIEAFVAGNLDGCTMTNMETLDMPAIGGIDCTSLITGDYSNGNDACLVRNNLTVPGLKGKEVLLVELSVSHYLLVRALEQAGMSEKDVLIKHTSDSDIATAFLTDPKQEVVVTWNPLVMTIEQEPGVTKLFTSADFPGEILDLMVVRTELLQEKPEVAKALVGAWYEVMSLMQQRGPAQKNALQQMAEASGCSLVEYTNQLRTTAMFYKAADAIAYTRGAEIKGNMDMVRRFCASHGLFGEGETNPDLIGISFPDGTVLGNPDKIRFRFNTDFMQMAADGQL